MNKNSIKKLVKFRQKITTEYINKRDMDAFLQIVKDKVHILVDIRWGILHKSKQGFSPKKFKDFLAALNIQYYYFKALGNPSHKDFTHTQFKEAKQAYLDYIHTDEDAQNAFIILFNLINTTKKQFCLICYCDTEDPKYCHRFWLLEALINHKRGQLGFTQDYVYETHVEKSLIEISEMNRKI